MMCKMETSDEKQSKIIFWLIAHHYTKNKGKLTNDIVDKKMSDFYGMKTSKDGVSFSKLPIALKRVLYTYLFHYKILKFRKL